MSDPASPEYVGPIRLWCWVLGDSDAFSIVIDNTQTVDDLKDAIKKKNSNTFEKVDAHRLDLWKVRSRMLHQSFKLTHLGSSIHRRLLHPKILLLSVFRARSPISLSLRCTWTLETTYLTFSLNHLRKGISTLLSTIGRPVSTQRRLRCTVLSLFRLDLPCPAAMCPCLSSEVKRIFTPSDLSIDINKIDEKIDKELKLLQRKLEIFLKNPDRPLWVPADYVTLHRDFLTNLRLPTYRNGRPSLLFHDLEACDDDGIKKVFGAGIQALYVIINVL
jgi:hypothetical protein